VTVCRSINTSIRLFAEGFDPPAPIVELGSYYVAGHPELGVTFFDPRGGDGYQRD